MEIILALMALGATPFGAALLADKPTKKRVERFIDIHWLQPLEAKVKPKSLAPNIIPKEFVKHEPRQKDTEADVKLATFWQDAFDWFTTPNREQLLKEALEVQQKHTEFLAPYKKAYEASKWYEHRGGRIYYWEIESRDEALKEWGQAQRDSPYKFTKEQEKVYGLHKKYGWEMIGNDLIRLASKDKLPIMDYIALTAKPVLV